LFSNCNKYTLKREQAERVLQFPWFKISFSFFINQNIIFPYNTDLGKNDDQENKFKKILLIFFLNSYVFYQLQNTKLLTFVDVFTCMTLTPTLLRTTIMSTMWRNFACQRSESGMDNVNRLMNETNSIVRDHNIRVSTLKKINHL